MLEYVSYDEMIFSGLVCCANQVLRPYCCCQQPSLFVSIWEICEHANVHSVFCRYSQCMRYSSANKAVGTAPDVLGYTPEIVSRRYLVIVIGASLLASSQNFDDARPFIRDGFAATAKHEPLHRSFLD